MADGNLVCREQKMYGNIWSPDLQEKIVTWNLPNCDSRTTKNKYVLPDDGYKLSETCRRYDNGPLVFLTSVLKYLNERFECLKQCGETSITVLILCTSHNKKCYETS
jgi:hypothetical protein